MPGVVTIAPRFCGPPGIANGGYVAGLLAQQLGGPAEVTLRRPTPLDRPLTLEPAAAGGAVLRDESGILAEAKHASPEMAAPAAPSFTEAELASRAYLGFTQHGASRCFVCGPGRAAADGLRVFAGPLAHSASVAAPWVPWSGLADDTGAVRPEFIWAALDCPGAFALMAGRHRPMLLGRLTARLDGRVQAGERCVVLAWPIAAEGRKMKAGSAVFGEDGALRAVAEAIWFEVAHY